MHAIIAFGQHTQSNDVGRSMPSSPLGSTHDRTTSGVARNHLLWTTHTVSNVMRGMMTSMPLDSTHARQRRALHDITALGLHTRLNNVKRGMQSSPLGSTDSRTTSGVACRHRPWMANMAKRRWAWHAIIAFGQHRWSDGVGRCMPSSALASTHNQTTSGVACHHRLWAAHTME